MMSLILYRTLVEYDHREVVLCVDVFGSTHLMTRVVVGDDEHRYYGVQISDARLRDLLEGRIDLRASLVRPEKREWNLCSVTDGKLTIDNRYDAAEESLLPLEGFVMGAFAFEDDVIMQEAAENDRTILHIALSDKNGGNSIALDALSDVSKLIQAFFKHLTNKVAAMSKEAKELLRGHEPGFSAFASAHGSFELHLKANDASKDLLEGAIVDNVLRHFDKLMQEQPDDAQILATFRPYAGHTISTYNSLVETLNKYEIGFKYAWASPAKTTVNRTRIDRTYVSHVSEVLKRTKELPTVTREFVGKVESLSLSRWKIHDEDSDRAVIGEATAGQLDGVLFNSARYKFVCEERIHTLELKEEDKKVYVLITKELLP